MSHLLIETDVKLIVAHLTANMPAELAAVSADHPDKSVPLSAPRAYYIYEPSAAFQAPAIFVIADSMDFRLQEKGANFIDALSRINATVVIEAKESDQLAIASWRYQAAMHKLLAQTRLTSADEKVVIVIKVVRASFSPVYTTAQQKGNPQGVFRKEVLLELDVEHYEKLT